MTFDNSSPKPLPKFSVITVSYNHAEFIRQTIQSVLWQRYPNFEHIVIDGGSTDGTIEILKSFPHLKWISEPDRGQSHALNKGFQRATGDIIAWMNSDDWYAPGTFHEVVKQLEDYPVVMGACELTDRYGIRKETVPNIERNWFDTLKYWVYYSSPAQPSIFFKRSLFDEFSRADGTVIDEDLEYAMDFDWWLRVQRRYPLSRRLQRVFSYYRTYDTNKTGAHMASTYREMSRVFRRHEGVFAGREQSLSFVVPITSSISGALDGAPALLGRVDGLTGSTIEVIFSDYSTDPAAVRRTRREVLNLEERFPRLTLRYTNVDVSAKPTRLDALDRGIQKATAPYVACIGFDSVFPDDYWLRVLRTFEHDPVAFLFPSLSPTLTAALVPAEASGAIGFESLFRLPTSELDFVVRKVAWGDAGGLSSRLGGTPGAVMGLKRFLLLLIHKGWRLLAKNLYAWPMGRAQSEEVADVFNLYTNCRILEDLRTDLHTMPFAELRAKHGFALTVGDELWSIAKRHLDDAPPEWHLLAGHLSAGQTVSFNSVINTPPDDSVEQRLRRALSAFPRFGPAHYLLSCELEKRGQVLEAAKVRSTWQEIHRAETTSPIYSKAP